MPDSKPPDEFNVGGYRGTGVIRVRTGWLGFAIAEEMIEYLSGERTWRRIPFPIEIVRSERRT